MFHSFFYAFLHLTDHITALYLNLTMGVFSQTVAPFMLALLRCTTVAKGSL